MNDIHRLNKSCARGSIAFLAFFGAEQLFLIAPFAS
jgi:hypothetical protein